MKKILAIILTLTCLFLFVGCSKQPTGQDLSNKESNVDIPAFDYKKEQELFFADNPGVEKDCFINTTECKITNASEAIERAKNECTIEYDTIDVFYDNMSDMWKAFFYTKGASEKTPKTPGSRNSQTVFLDGNGRTCNIVYTE